MKHLYVLLTLSFTSVLSDEVSVTQVKDVDGNTYKTVTIGQQVWMAENLKVTHFSNGEKITFAAPKSWTKDKVALYSRYDDNQELADTYGLLYNWSAVWDKRNICMEGWHVPTDKEWKAMAKHVGGMNAFYNDTGSKLKEQGFSHWNEPNTGANNSSGFSALPAGGIVQRGNRIINGKGVTVFGYGGLGKFASFWSRSAYDKDHAWFYSLKHNKNRFTRLYNVKYDGLSVRCVKDNLSN